jgi:flagellin-like protein
MYTITPKGGIERKMKILKCKKALSPVVASIILIAVTVAVSIAVAAWMGALTFSFMGTEQVTVQKISWTWGASGIRTFTVTANNTGTKDVTISQILVNYAGVTGTSITPTLPYILKATGTTAQKSVTFTVKYDYSNGTNYDISVVTSDNYKFTNTFQGGVPSG